MNGLSIGAALLAGLLSFLSPCVLPLIPGYLSFVSGCNAEEILTGKKRGRVFLRTVFFVLGFSLVFVALGIIFSGSGLLLAGSKARAISIAAGLIIVLFGLNMIFDFLHFLNREVRAHASRKPAGIFGSLVVGMAFGAGWTPCIGPILGSILLLASQSGSVPKAFFLLTVYSAGLAVPFLLAGLFFDRMTPLLRWFKKHGREIRIGSGALLVLLGSLMALGRLTVLNSVFIKAGYQLQSALAENPSLVNFWSLIVSGSFAAAALALILAFWKKPRRIFRVAALGIFILLFALNLSGIVNGPALLAGWLTFQG